MIVFCGVWLVLGLDGAWSDPARWRRFVAGRDGAGTDKVWCFGFSQPGMTELCSVVGLGFCPVRCLINGESEPKCFDSLTIVCSVMVLCVWICGSCLCFLWTIVWWRFSLMLLFAVMIDGLNRGWNFRHIEFLNTIAPTPFWVYSRLTEQEYRSVAHMWRNMDWIWMGMSHWSFA